MKQILILILAIPMWLFSYMFKGSEHSSRITQQDSSAFKFPFVLCAMANKPKLIKDGNPFVFIEFVSEDSVFGYMGSYPYKGSIGYAEQWLFNLRKVASNKYESEWVHSSNHDKYPLKLFNSNSSWYFKKDSFKPLKLENISNCGCNDTTRKHVYVESLMKLKYYENGITGERIGGLYRYKTNPYLNKIYNLPFEELRSKVNAMSLRELHLLFGIDTTGLD
ncbi:MAG: hypothetical protein Q8R57_14415 [Bacteroidota bacterium]|nr:hypothetical protein [Bacteroidota bacterium]